MLRKVTVEDVNGSKYDIIGTKILSAYESTGSAKPYGTYTFYHIQTVKGDVTIRWLGVSNGYYSEKVSFVEY